MGGMDSTAEEMHELFSLSTNLGANMLRVYVNGMGEMRRVAMYQVNRLLDIIVSPSNLRPWAREHLDLQRLDKWHHREIAQPTLAEFREIRDVLLARGEIPTVCV